MPILGQFWIRFWPDSGSDSAPILAPTLDPELARNVSEMCKNSTHFLPPALFPSPLPQPVGTPKSIGNAFFLQNRAAGIMGFPGDIVAIADGERRGQIRAPWEN